MKLQPQRVAAPDEILLNDAASTFEPADSLAHGHSVLMLPSIANADECQLLRAAASAAALRARQSHDPKYAGHPSPAFEPSVQCVRMPAKVMFDADCTMLCEALLLRALSALEAELPSVNNE